MFDFSNTPEVIQNISWQLRNYIQLGILYWYTDYIGSLKTLTLTRDFQKTLNNSRVKFIKFNKKLLILSERQERKIKNALIWMKSNNHLTSIYPTIYEWEELKNELEKLDPSKAPNDNDFIIIEPINADREFRDQQVIEILVDSSYLQMKFRTELWKNVRSLRISLIQTNLLYSLEIHI